MDSIFVKTVLVLLLFTATSVTAQDDGELIDMVIGFVGDSDKDIRSLAFEQIRTKVPGKKATERFAAEIPKLTADAQIGMLNALADRGDGAAKPAVKKLLDSKADALLQVAALRALGKLGDASDTGAIVSQLENKTTEIGRAAEQSLLQLQGADVSAEIVKAIKASATPLKVKLIAALTSRRAMDTIPTLLEWAKGTDATIRAAAMKSLGQLAGPEHVASMVQAVLAAKVGSERNDAEKNVMFVCNRIEDKEKRVEPLLKAFRRLGIKDRTAMIPSLGRVGGQAAWVEVEKALASRDAKIHMGGIRAISNWPDASVADELVKLAKTDRHRDHQRIARMSILRIAPLPDGRSDAEKLDLLKTGMELAANDKERNYGIKRAAAIRLVETLRFVLPYVDQPAYAAQACQAVVELAHDRQLRDDNKPEFHAALDKVLMTTSDATLKDRATRYKKGQTWVRPK